MNNASIRLTEFKIMNLERESEVLAVDNGVKIICFCKDKILNKVTKIHGGPRY